MALDDVNKKVVAGRTKYEAVVGTAGTETQRTPGEGATYEGRRI